MKNSLWIIVILVIFLHIRRRRQAAAAVWKAQLRRKQNKEIFVMKELAKQLIGKDCIVYTIASFDGGIPGVIKSVEDGGMVIQRESGELEIINLDFVTRIREYPRKKNGKKKGLVLD